MVKRTGILFIYEERWSDYRIIRYDEAAKTEIFRGLVYRTSALPTSAANSRSSGPESSGDEILRRLKSQSTKAGIAAFLQQIIAPRLVLSVSQSR
jgi:hypothetical protein